MQTRRVDDPSSILLSVALTVVTGYLGLVRNIQELKLNLQQLSPDAPNERAIVYCSLAIVVTVYAMHHKPSPVGAVGAPRWDCCRPTRSIQILCKICVLDLAEHAKIR